MTAISRDLLHGGTHGMVQRFCGQIWGIRDSAPYLKQTKTPEMGVFFFYVDNFFDIKKE